MERKIMYNMISWSVLQANPLYKLTTWLNLQAAGMPRRASVVPVSNLSFSEVSTVAWRYFQSKTGKPKGVLFIPPMNKVSLETNKVAFGKITSCWPSPWPKQTWGYTYAVWSGIPSRVLDLWDLSIVTVLWRSKRREKRSCPNYLANTRKLPMSFSAYFES